MDERELDFSTPEVFSGQSAGEDVPSSCSIESLFDDILNDGHTCTHTHTCNPPGPDLSHTHTCFHVHTKILSASPGGETAESPDKSTKRRPCTNRDAVRKYRERKKAHAASLEEEVAHLRVINQKLLKRIQGQDALEAEVARLKCLLVDVRGRIEGEIGSFPYQKSAIQGSMLGGGSAQVLCSCGFHCEEQAYCHYARMQGKSLGDQSYAGNIQCMACAASGFGAPRGAGNGAAARAGDGSSNQT